MLLIIFLHSKMELPSKLFEQIVYKTRPKIEEHMLIIMDKSVTKRIYLSLFKLILSNSK